MSSISLAQAQTLIAGALAVARQKAYKPMGVVVVDTAAQAIAFAREDGASALRLDIAHGKAGAAIGMGTNSRTLAVRAKDLPAFFEHHCQQCAASLYSSNRRCVNGRHTRRHHGRCGRLWRHGR
jgi:uncharacterized protein GlcG (DUF336 family)